MDALNLEIELGDGRFDFLAMRLGKSQRRTAITGKMPWRGDRFAFDPLGPERSFQLENRVDRETEDDGLLVHSRPF